MATTAARNDDGQDQPGDGVILATKTRGSAYAGLSRRIKNAGLLDRLPGYYALRFGIVLGLFFGGWAAFFWIGDSWFQLILAVVLGVLSTQVAFLGHDVGHKQVFRSRRPAEITGLLLGNVGIGMSYGWWMGKHTRHHANPNHTEHDPDVDVGVLAWTERQAADGRSGVSRFIAKWQAVLFFPLLTLEGLQLHYASFRALGDRDVHRKGLEGALLSVHVIGYLVLLFAILSPGKAIAFLAIHQAVFGIYMGSSFAPNHKGMPVFEGENKLTCYLRKQVLTSRNVRGNWFVDYLFGGLNYQIEHHLFPNMPMPNLRRARPLVREYCAEHGIDYYETGIIRSYREALAHLHEAGAALRASRGTAPTA